MGELSSARQALQGADLVPGNDETLRALRQRQEPIPALMQLRPRRQHELDDKLLGKNLKSAKRGAGPFWGPFWGSIFGSILGVHFWVHFACCLSGDTSFNRYLNKNRQESVFRQEYSLDKNSSLDC